MVVALFYYRVILLMVIFILAAVALAVPFIILIVKKKKTARNITGSMMGVMVLMAGCIFAWLATHTCRPDLFDWDFKGKNINDIRQEYGEFSDIKINEDGSGYAEYETENLVGHSVVIEDDVFRMDFDSTGKIIHIDSHGPVGG